MEAASESTGAAVNNDHGIKRRSTMRRTLSALLALPVLLLVSASAVMAAGPTITEDTFAPGPVPWGPTCNGEPLMVSFSVDRRTETFFNGSTAVLIRRHVQGGGIVWLNSTGSSLPYDADFTSTMDLTAHTNRITGQWAHVIIPGSGIILKNSGLLVQDITTRPPTVIDESNSHDSFDPGGVSQLCAALGG
jgi:hypothetical protein